MLSAIKAGIPAPTDHTRPKSLPSVGILSRGRSVAALADGQVNENPIARLPKTKKEPPRTEGIRPLSDEELMRFLETANNDRPERRRHAVLYGGEDFALFLPWRVRELRPAKTSHFNGWISILTARDAGRTHTVSIRTSAARRQDARAALTETASFASALAALYKHREAQAFARGWREVPQYVFINDRGQPLDESRVRKQFTRIMRQARISGHNCTTCGTF
jgi:integrase